MPEPGAIFDMRATAIPPLRQRWVNGFTSPGTIHLGRAYASAPSDRVGFLVHGLAMNEDYFGLLVPELTARGYDVWAMRLPGYVASGERAPAWPPRVGLSIALYAEAVASTMAHLARTLVGRRRELLAWGHSLGGAALVHALATCVGPAWTGPDRVVLEAPAFGEAIPLARSTIAGFAAAPEHVLNELANGFLLDDVCSSDFAGKVCLPLVPGRTSRAVFTMNVLALVSPLSRTPRLSAEWLARSWFVSGRIDRLVDHQRLERLLDEWGIGGERRLVLPRNHLLSLTSAREIVSWLERAPGGVADATRPGTRRHAARRRPPTGRARAPRS